MSEIKQLGVSKVAAAAFVRESTKVILAAIAKLTDEAIDAARINGEDISETNKALIRRIRAAAQGDYESALKFNELSFSNNAPEYVVVTNDKAQRSLLELLERAASLEPHLAIRVEEIKKRGVLNVLLDGQSALRNEYVGVNVPQTLLNDVLYPSGLISKPGKTVKEKAAVTTGAEVSDF